MNKAYTPLIILLPLVITFLFQKNTTKNPEKLAKKYCSTCHIFPEPDELTKAIWKESVLPNMGARLGIQTVLFDPYANKDQAEIAYLKSINVYPENPMISEKEWSAITDYYIRNAPENFLNSDSITLQGDEDFPFTAKEIKIGNSNLPQITLLEYNEDSEEYFICDRNTLYVLDRYFNVDGSWNLQSPLSDMGRVSKTDYVLGIGSFEPSGLKNGVLFPLKADQGAVKADHFLDSLARPVHFNTGDLNGDGQTDLVLCCFGNHEGKLSWFDDMRVEHVLSGLPGARMTEIIDIDGDGDSDIVAMMTQAYENIDLYKNDGNGNFEKSNLLSFSPLHGLSHFQLVDFNQDGHVDLLVSNGDNWDYSQINKPYHGVRIYLNDGNGDFDQKYFYKLYGCNKAMAHDFDGDGDLDIVASAFFSKSGPYMNHFTYLENLGGWDFIARSTDIARQGHWLTMDLADVNNDGRKDVLLGSYYHNLMDYSEAISQAGEIAPQILLLEYH